MQSTRDVRLVHGLVLNAQGDAITGEDDGNIWDTGGNFIRL